MLKLLHPILKRGRGADSFSPQSIDSRIDSFRCAPDVLMHTVIPKSKSRNAASQEGLEMVA